MPACPFYQLIRFPPSVGLSINKFQPTLTVVKYSPTWHLVGDSQSLGMLQTAPLSLREGREEIQAWGAPFPWRSVFSPQHPRLARALECPPGEDSHHTCFHLLEPRWVLKWGNCAHWLGGATHGRVPGPLQPAAALPCMLSPPFLEWVLALNCTVFFRSHLSSLYLLHVFQHM